MDGVDESLYGDGGGSSEPKSEPKSKPGSVDEQNEDKATDILSKSSFPGGCKVGDKYEVEITGDHGDQFSVKVVKPEEKETTPSDAGSGEDPELSDLNSKY